MLHLNIIHFGCHVFLSYLFCAHGKFVEVTHSIYEVQWWRHAMYFIIINYSSFTLQMFFAW